MTGGTGRIIPCGGRRIIRDGLVHGVKYGKLWAEVQWCDVPIYELVPAESLTLPITCLECLAIGPPHE